MSGVTRVMLWMVALSGSLAHGQDAVTVTLVDGRVHTGVLARWTAAEVWLEGEPQTAIPTADLVSLDWQQTSLATMADPLILLANGDRLHAWTLRVQDDRVLARWARYADWKPFEIPLEQVRSLVFEPPRAQQDRRWLWTELSDETSGRDILWLKNQERLDGEFDGLDDALLDWNEGAEFRRLDRSRIRAVKFDPDLLTVPQPGALTYLISLRDGSHFTAREVVASNDASIRATLAGVGVVVVPCSECLRCEVLGPRVVSLLDRMPVQQRHVPYLSAAWPIVPNANVWHGPLQVRGRQFARGLGVHSQTVLEYAVELEDVEFQVGVGLDDETHARGAVTFSIELDGHEVWSSGVLTRRSELLTSPRIALAGSSRLTLMVGFGPEGDTGGHANWCHPIIFRKAAR